MVTYVLRALSYGLKTLALASCKTKILACEKNWVTKLCSAKLIDKGRQTCGLNGNPDIVRETTKVGWTCCKKGGRTGRRHQHSGDKEKRTTTNAMRELRKADLLVRTKISRMRERRTLRDGGVSSHV